MSSYIDSILLGGDPECLAHAICSKATSDLNRRQAIDGILLDVLSVETFFGETTNGGVIQFIVNQPDIVVNRSPSALSNVGLEDYANVMRQVLALFPEGKISKEACPMEQIDRVCASSGSDVFDAAEEPFWEKYLANKNEFRSKLHNFILIHIDSIKNLFNNP